MLSVCFDFNFKNSFPKMEKNYLDHKNKVDQLWYDIQDIIGPGLFWPKWIVDLFFTRPLKHHMRPLITCVCNFQWAESRGIYSF